MSYTIMWWFEDMVHIVTFGMSYTIMPKQQSALEWLWCTIYSGDVPSSREYASGHTRKKWYKEIQNHSLQWFQHDIDYLEYL